MIATHTIPSLQGTLAKRSKQTLQPNFAKEPFRPSRSNAGLRHGTNLIDKQIEYINRQCLTCGHKTVGVQWFASISSRINFINGGYERSPKTQPFHTAKPLLRLEVA